MSAALYDIDILRLAASIPHLGPLSHADAQTERRSPICGSRVVVYVKLDADGRIAALGQEVFACALGQASAALMGAHAIGVSHETVVAARDALAAWLKQGRDAPPDWPGIDRLAAARAYPGRHAAILLPFEALAEAMARAGSRAGVH